MHKKGDGKPSRNIDKYDIMCYNFTGNAYIRQAALLRRKEVITMVTYEGVFTLIIMITGVIALFLDIIKFFKDKK